MFDIAKNQPFDFIFSSVVSRRRAPIAGFTSSHTRLKPMGKTFGSATQVGIYQRFSLKNFFTLSGIIAIKAAGSASSGDRSFRSARDSVQPSTYLLPHPDNIFQQIKCGVIVPCFLYQSFQPSKTVFGSLEIILDKLNNISENGFFFLSKLKKGFGK
jgi:hypothetical protein